MITPSISFRVPTHPSLPEYRHWFEEDAPWEESLIDRLYDMSLSLAKESTWDTTSRRAQTKRAEWSENVKDNNASGRGTFPVQNYGHVDIKQGRMIAWPNIMHHRFSGIQLQDKTRPGKMSFVQVSLVDPEQRIVSTANVPLRRGDWFGDALFQSGKDWGKVSKELTGLLIEQGAEVPIGVLQEIQNVGGGEKDKARIKRPHLPNELMDMVWDELSDDHSEALMPRRATKEIRLELMEGRERFRKKMEENLGEDRSRWMIPAS